MRKVLSILFVLGLLLVIVLPTAAQGGTSAQPTSRKLTDGPASAAAATRYIIYFKDFSHGAAAVRTAGGNVKHEFSAYSAVAAHLPAQALQGLQNNPNVTLIEADAPRQLMATGDVPTTG
ncbi:MAG: hypothetical protein H0T73_22890, partial [Ardenticatenales bacterium]|nr:hypothetical protein [Ardenticatenales bacterium]